MLSTKKQEEDKEDVLDVSELFFKDENKKGQQPEEKSKE